MSLLDQHERVLINGGCAAENEAAPFPYLSPTNVTKEALTRDQIPRPTLLLELLHQQKSRTGYLVNLFTMALGRFTEDIAPLALLHENTSPAGMEHIVGFVFLFPPKVEPDRVRSRMELSGESTPRSTMELLGGRHEGADGAQVHPPRQLPPSLDENEEIDQLEAFIEGAARLPKKKKKARAAAKAKDCLMVEGGDASEGSGLGLRSKAAPDSVSVSKAASGAEKLAPGNDPTSAPTAFPGNPTSAASPFPTSASGKAVGAEVGKGEAAPLGLLGESTPRSTMELLGARHEGAGGAQVQQQQLPQPLDESDEILELQLAFIEGADHAARSPKKKKKARATAKAKDCPTGAEGGEVLSKAAPVSVSKGALLDSVSVSKGLSGAEKLAPGNDPTSAPTAFPGRKPGKAVGAEVGKGAPLLSAGVEIDETETRPRPKSGKGKGTSGVSAKKQCKVDADAPRPQEAGAACAPCDHSSTEKRSGKGKRSGVSVQNQPATVEAGDARPQAASEVPEKGGEARSAPPGPAKNKTESKKSGGPKQEAAAVRTQQAEAKQGAAAVRTQQAEAKQGAAAVRTQQVEAKQAGIAVRTQKVDSKQGGIAVRTQKVEAKQGGIAVRTQKSEEKQDAAAVRSQQAQANTNRLDDVSSPTAWKEVTGPLGRRLRKAEHKVLMAMASKPVDQNLVAASAMASKPVDQKRAENLRGDVGENKAQFSAIQPKNEKLSPRNRIVGSAVAPKQKESEGAAGGPVVPPSFAAVVASGSKGVAPSAATAGVAAVPKAATAPSTSERGLSSTATSTSERGPPIAAPAPPKSFAAVVAAPTAKDFGGAGAAAPSPNSFPAPPPGLSWSEEKDAGAPTHSATPVYSAAMLSSSASPQLLELLHTPVDEEPEARTIPAIPASFAAMPMENFRPPPGLGPPGAGDDDAVLVGPSRFGERSKSLFGAIGENPPGTTASSSARADGLNPKAAPFVPNSHPMKLSGLASSANSDVAPSDVQESDAPRKLSLSSDLTTSRSFEQNDGGLGQPQQPWGVAEVPPYVDGEEHWGGAWGSMGEELGGASGEALVGVAEWDSGWPWGEWTEETIDRYIQIWNNNYVYHQSQQAEGSAPPAMRHLSRI